MRHRVRARWTAAVLVLALIGFPTGGLAQSAPQVVDLQGGRVDPFRTLGDVATVFLFASVGCPVSNRYAPEVRRLYDAFASRGVRFWLIYPNPAETAAMVGRHLEEYGYPIAALRDPDHQLVTRAGATITPEAVVYDRVGRMVYRGRLDNRYVSLGRERPAATIHDLEDVLEAVAGGRPAAQAAQPAVGCFIADFVHIHE